METTDWSALGFDYRKTDWNVRYSYTDGKWSPMEVTQDEYIKMHMSASCLHYGIELFEGLKAFRGVDGKVRLFRVADNARRLQSSAERLCLPVPSIEMIVDACIEVVKRNERFVPPYGTGASLYLRPVMFGTTVGLGVKPAKEALLIVYCSPVGAYFKGGIKPIRVAIDREQDRAAPRGTGDVKGRAATMRPACFRERKDMNWAIPISCISMPPNINISKSAVLPTFSASKRVSMLPRNHLRCCPLLPI